MTTTPAKAQSTVRLAAHGFSCNTRVEVMLVTPEQAAAWLKTNFKQNRKLNKTRVKNLAADIKQERFKLSCDCIAFDEKGELINGQHRLNAVVVANEAALFLVALNFPKASVQVLDIGKKRMMHERVTVAGVPMLEKECAAIRNAMTKWTGKTSIGTTQLCQIRHDSIVVEAYKDHVLWLKLMGALGYLKAGGIPTFFPVAAHLIYAEGQRRQKIVGTTPTGISPLQRALQFMECVTTGGIELTGQFQGSRDRSAAQLRDAYLASRAKNKAWSTFDCFAITTNMAKKFHDGETVGSIRMPTQNPFGRHIGEYGETNDSLLECFSHNLDYLNDDVMNQALDEYEKACEAIACAD